MILINTIVALVGVWVGLSVTVYYLGRYVAGTLPSAMLALRYINPVIWFDFLYQKGLDHK